MPEPKTRPTTASVTEFLSNQERESRRQECRVICSMMEEVSRAPAVMWGNAMVGFGTYSQRYANGQRLDWPRIAFSPRKATLVVYVWLEPEQQTELLSKLGPHKMGKSCLHLKKLQDINLDVLRQIMETSMANMEGLYPR